jgi:hypothetical protein
MTTETMDPPTEAGEYNPGQIPSHYAIVPGRPAPTRKAANYNPQLVAHLQETLDGRSSLQFPLEGLDDRQANRLAARLNAVGRRGDAPFTVRTRRQGDRLFAWAVPKQPARTRKSKE